MRLKFKTTHLGVSIVGFIVLVCVAFIGINSASTRNVRKADRLLAEGLDFSQVSQFHEALASWEKALLIYRKTGYRDGEALVLTNIGSTYSSLGDHRSAADFHRQALDIAREIEYPYIEAAAFSNLGNIYNETGKYQRAINFHEKALEIARRFVNRSQEANSLANLGLSYVQLGDYKEAIRFHEESLEILRRIEDPIGEAGALGNLGLSYHYLGDYKKAIDNYQSSLDISREINYPVGEANALSNLGNAYRSVGNLQQASIFHMDSLNIFREVRSPLEQSSALSNLAGISYLRGDYERSLKLYEKSLVIDREILNKPGEFNSLLNIGLLYSDLDDDEKAVEYHQQSLEGFRQIGDSSGEMSALLNLGVAFSNRKQPERAFSLQEEALEIAREIGNRDIEALILENIGTTYANEGNQEKAEDFFSKATYTQDSLRTASLSDLNRISLFERQSRSYKKLELALVSQEKFDEALEVSERSRARSFVQMMVDKQLSLPDDEIIVDPLSIAEIQKIAKDHQSVIVEYSVISKEEPSIHIWVVQPTGEIQFREASLKSDPLKLLNLVSESRHAMGIRGRGSSVSGHNDEEMFTTRTNLSELYKILIDPIAELLPADPEQRVVFIPQSELFLVPFPALLDSAGKYLIEEHTIMTSPSIQLLDMITDRLESLPSPAEMSSGVPLIVGNPTMPEIWNPRTTATEPLPSLPGTQKEAASIANLLEVPVLTGSEATEYAVKKKISDASIVHLATHGLLDYGNPSSSGTRDIPGLLALTGGNGEDGLLTSAEILEELSLEADLVVLSACDTGVGDITSDGVVGLSRSFISAGASSTVVSLWSIPDAPTAALMIEFYQQMQQGKDKAHALRQAMLITMKSYPNPRDWAAFTLIGDAG